MAITLYLTVLTKETKNLVLVIVSFLILTYILNKLEPTLECRTFLTVFHDARVETDPGLLALAYAVSILEEINL
jgi:hypothetical protein